MPTDGHLTCIIMNSELPVMLMGFAVVAVVSETLAGSGVDVVDGSFVTVYLR